MKESKYTIAYAYEQLMRENNPNIGEYDSGADGVLPECRSCRFHRPHWTYQSCCYVSCPYSSKKVSTLKNQKGGNQIESQNNSCCKPKRRSW